MTKILLVEDDKSLREIYGVRLLAEGYDIVSAGDGEEALAMAIKERPDLILSDVMMPKISGFDMLDILRSTTETKNIKVIIMTALSSEDQRQRGESLGADMYLVKSQVGIEDVVRAVKDVLARSNTSQEPQYRQNTSEEVQPAAPAANQPPAQQATAPIPPVFPDPSVQQQPNTPTPQTNPTPPRPANAAVLPQPTAPFSTPRESSSGSIARERVIQPPQRPKETYDVARAMSEALQSDSRGAVPVPPAPNTSVIPAGQQQQSTMPVPPRPSEQTTQPQPQNIPARPQPVASPAPAPSQTVQPTTPQNIPPNRPIQATPPNQQPQTPQAPQS